MKGIFGYDGVLYRITERIGNLILLNLLYLICCIPIVTIGPATIALHYVTLKYAEKTEDRVWAPFFHSFRQNLKQGIIVGLISTVIGAFLAFDLSYIYQIASNEMTFNKFILVAVALASIVYLMAITYVYPLLARFDNSLRQMFRTTIILAIRHLPATVCMTIIAAAPILLLFYTPTSFLIALTFYFFIGFATVAFLQDKLMARIFWQYIPKESDEDEEE